MGKESDEMSNDSLSILCPYCAGHNVNHFGKVKNKQYYWCRSCKRKFTVNTFARTNEAKRFAMGLKRDGVDIITIAQKIKARWGGTTHFSTIYRWGLLKPTCPHCGAINPRRYGKYKNRFYLHLVERRKIW